MIPYEYDGMSVCCLLACNYVRWASHFKVRRRAALAHSQAFWSTTNPVFQSEHRSLPAVHSKFRFESEYRYLLVVHSRYNAFWWSSDRPYLFPQQSARSKSNINIEIMLHHYIISLNPAKWFLLSLHEDVVTIIISFVLTYVRGKLTLGYGLTWLGNRWNPWPRIQRRWLDIAVGTLFISKSLAYSLSRLLDLKEDIPSLEGFVHRLTNCLSACIHRYDRRHTSVPSLTNCCGISATSRNLSAIVYNV